MTLQEMLTDLTARIGSQGSNPEVNTGNMTTWLNTGMVTFCNEHDWSWLEKRSTTTAVAAQTNYTLPSDFSKMVELQVDGTESSPNPYTFSTYEQRVLASPGTKQVSMFGGEFILYPAPAGGETITLAYIRRPTLMASVTDSPIDAAIANMPAVYHEAVVLHAFATYNSFDEEQAEAESIMGSVNSPRPGTYYYYVDMALREDEQKKRGQRTKMLSKQEFVGYSYPNATAGTTTVLRN